MKIWTFEMSLTMHLFDFSSEYPQWGFLNGKISLCFCGLLVCFDLSYDWSVQNQRQILEFFMYSRFSKWSLRKENIVPMSRI